MIVCFFILLFLKRQGNHILSLLRGIKSNLRISVIKTLLRNNDIQDNLFLNLHNLRICVIKTLLKNIFGETKKKVLLNIASLNFCILCVSCISWIAIKYSYLYNSQHNSNSLFLGNKNSSKRKEGQFRLRIL